LVWSCELTGRSGLTYQEAEESEEAAKKRLSSFPKVLQKVVVYLAIHTHRSRLSDVTDDVFVFAKDRFFIGEIVEVTQKGQKYEIKECFLSNLFLVEFRLSCKIIKVVPPEEEKQKIDSDADSDVICLDDDLPSSSTKQFVGFPCFMPCKLIFALFQGICVWF
jgi:bromodomain adjacent to zinc finger domain protein 1A